MTAASLLLAVAFGAADPPAERPNVLLICVDDLRPELGSFGADWITSPNIDALAARGRAFHRHYVQAPTCGASRYALLTGNYGPAGNGALFERAKRMRSNPEAVSPSLPAWFRQHGYTTVSVGKVSHHPGGRGGGNWDDDAQPEMPDSWDRHLMPTGPWQHPRGAMHGLANGEIRTNAKGMAVVQSTPGPDTTYPDGLITDESLSQLDQLSESRTAEDKPFFLAVGLIRPHLPFGAPADDMTPYADATLPPTPHPQKPAGQTTWHGSGEFMKYDRFGRDPNKDAAFAEAVRKHYAACVTYADRQVGRLLERLDETGQRENTIVVLWGDHGWHLGEHAIWGKHALFEESLRSPLIVSYSGLPQPGEASRAVVESIDLFPTLCDLAALPAPAGEDGTPFVDGRSLRPLLEDPAAGQAGDGPADGGSACAYTGGAETIRTDSYRLIAHRGGHLELYDHRTPEAETQNLAEAEPETAVRLLARLRERLGNR
ncbi:sulfatase [Alienimonas californiensis]|uniref:Arylsulfatase n=1 Tax=Alienimonas californiensis TaxID=2527989 RepID=A0A517P8L0_9PLAN|nr:sulfatase [Alienimonas californiensis]QDT15719.1 Arylsulfatase [Alienimonas californiensis]